MSKLKIGIGFHTSAACYCDGIGGYLSSISDGGHTITAKSVDSATSLVDFQTRIQKGAEGYGIYRCLRDHDVPNYGASVKFEAQRYLEKINRYFPPELDKNLFYIEMVNECDKNHADWLGELMCEMGTLFMDSGYRFCGPGWSPGEPEPEHNRATGMLSWLKLCAENRGELAYAVHEYAFDNTMDSQRPWLMGRIADVNAACVENGIGLPDIFITEFGWSYRTAPHWKSGVPQIIDQIDWYLANTPNLKAVHIWALDKSSQWADISSTINPYMQPLIGHINSHNWQTPVIPDPPPAGLPDPSNILNNPSFEFGWTDHTLYPSRIRVPINWSILAVPIGEYTSSINQKTGKRSVVSGVVEATHKNRDLLPPEEWPEGSNPLISDGDWSFKIQADYMVSETILSQNVTGLLPNTAYRFSIKAKVHYHPDESSIGEPDDIHVNIHCSYFNQIEYLVSNFPHKAVEWTQMSVVGMSNDKGILYAAISFETMWKNSRDIFLDDAVLELETSVPSVPAPKPIKFVEYVYPQEFIESDYDKITTIAWHDYKRSLGGSIDHAIAVMQSPLASSESYVVVWNPDRPSQISAIEKLIATGVSFQTRYIISAPDLFPANINLGYLFNWRYLLTSPFNAPRSYANGLHEGVDYDIIGGLANNLIPVLCTYDGVVDKEGEGDKYGLYVRIKHQLNGREFFTWYCHLDEIYVAVGDSLIMGNEVGDIGNTGNSFGEHIHFNLEIPGYGLDGYAVANVVDPFPYLPDPSGLPIYKVPQVTYDIASYMYGDGRMYEVRHGDGQTETFQVRQRGSNSNDFDLIKNSQYESMSYDDQYVWRGIDTSPGGAPVYAERPGASRYYIQAEAGKTMARWVLRNMAIGQTYTGPGHHVQFYYKNACSPSMANSGSATNRVTLVEHYNELTWNGITVKDIIVLQTNTGEKMFFAKGYGLVAWSNSSGGQSAICEILSGRPNLIKESGCFSNG